MKTEEVIKSGIDRNFLRRCEDSHKLIQPKRDNGIDIVNAKYRPRDYSQEEVEIVWYAYLCRKMGLSFEEIKDLLHGKEISLRDSMNRLIQKYEEEISELQAIIDFMKYVKGFGYIPTPPKELAGSKNFREYLLNFMDSFDDDKKLKGILDVVGELLNIDESNNLDQEGLLAIEQKVRSLCPNFSDCDFDEYSRILMALGEKTDLGPSCDEVQELVRKLFDMGKKLFDNTDLSAWDFAANYIFGLSADSDMSALYEKILGEGGCEYLINALVRFLVIEEPDKIQKIVAKSANK